MSGWHLPERTVDAAYLGPHVVNSTSSRLFLSLPAAQHTSRLGQGQKRLLAFSVLPARLSLGRNPLSWVSLLLYADIKCASGTPYLMLSSTPTTLAPGFWPHFLLKLHFSSLTGTLAQIPAHLMLCSASTVLSFQGLGHYCVTGVLVCHFFAVWSWT